MTELKVEDVEKQFEQLAQLEKEFEKNDVQILRETYARSLPLFERRNAITNAIPGFWPHVLEDASSSLGFDEYITPDDAEALSHVTELNVVRPDVVSGEPRNITISFKFKDNDFMPAQTIEKAFTFVETEDLKAGLTGLISTPVRIEWKEGKDLTGGVNEAAWEAFEERKERAAKQEGKGKGTAKGNKRGEKEQKLQKLLNKNPGSFFNWFSYTGVHPELGEKSQPRGDFDDSDDDADADDEHSGRVTSHVEAFPSGDEIAVQFSEDVYPCAVKYFTSSLEDDDEDEDEEAEVDLDSDIEEILARQTSSASAGKKGKRNGSSEDGPVKKKVKKST